jgi:hypothetical protein
MGKGPWGAITKSRLIHWDTIYSSIFDWFVGLRMPWEKCTQAQSCLLRTKFRINVSQPRTGGNGRASYKHHLDRCIADMLELGLLAYRNAYDWVAIVNEPVLWSCIWMNPVVCRVVVRWCCTPLLGTGDALRRWSTSCKHHQLCDSFLLTSSLLVAQLCFSKRQSRTHGFSINSWSICFDQLDIRGPRLPQIDEG